MSNNGGVQDKASAAERFSDAGYIDHAFDSDRAREVAHYKEALAELQRDFDELVYSISHDFKAPLRGIHSVSEWLAADYGEQLGEQGNSYLALIRSRTDRMGQMIDRLLRYSRVGRYEPIAEPISLTDVIKVLHERTEGRCTLSVAINSDEGVRLVDCLNLFNVFSELIDNAAQFSGQEPCELTVSGGMVGDCFQFVFSDNGKGISEDVRGKVLNLFYSTKSADDVVHCGMGLPICRKTVLNVGGVFEISSVEGCESTISVSWPLVKQEDVGRC